MAYSKKSPDRVAANLHHEASREAHSKAAEATGIGKADQAQSWNSRAMEHRDMEVHHNAKSGPAPKIQTESKGVKLRAFAERGKGADPIAQSRKASRAASQKGAASASVKQAEAKLAASPAHGRLEAARAKLGKASKSESEWLGKMRGVISAKRDVRAVERKKGPTAPIQTSARGAKYYTNKSGEKVYVK